jgi:hypothetical protein
MSLVCSSCGRLKNLMCTSATKWLVLVCKSQIRTKNALFGLDTQISNPFMFSLLLHYLFNKVFFVDFILNLGLLEKCKNSKTQRSYRK